MAMANLFERLSKERPAEAKIKPQHEDPAQRLLNWLLQWNKDTVCTADILIYGPATTRKRKAAIDATETLVKYGWLIPQKTKQSNWRQWQIVRKPIIRPNLAD
jgi:hypothetical protein